jgi:DNA-binding MarR family transcriptional regulator
MSSPDSPPDPIPGTSHEATLDRLAEAPSRTWRLFVVAHARIVEQIEQDLAAAGLPPLAWYDVLWTLEQAPEHELRLHELAEQVLLSRSNITRLSDRLEAAGLICRRRCPKDRRGAYAVLTEVGLAMRSRMWQVYAAGIQRYFAAHLSESELATISAGFERVLAALPERTSEGR